MPDGNRNLEKGQAYFSNLRQGDKVKEVLWLCCYKCGEDGLLSDHTITKNPDGTITVSPSIVCPNDKCDGHYHIKNSEIV